MEHDLVKDFFWTSSIFFTFNGVRLFGNQLCFYRRVQIYLVELLEGRSLSHGRECIYF